MATMTDLITMGYDTKTNQPVTIAPADMTRGCYSVGKIRTALSAEFSPVEGVDNGHPGR